MKKCRLILICLILLVFSSGSVVLAQNSGKDLKQTLEVGGLRRSYLLHIPQSYQAAKPTPVVLAFHGGGGRARSMNRLAGLNAFSEKAGFIVVYPEGLERHWNDGRNVPNKTNYDDVSFVSKLIDELEKNWNVDSKRIYATGISNGGFFCQTLVSQLSNKIAAIAPVAASMTEEFHANDKPQHPVPILYILGTEDPLVPYNGGMIKLWGFKGGKVVAAADAIKFWVEHNQCKPDPAVSQLNDKSPGDGTHVTVERYCGSTPKSDVVAYIIQGGGHTWPSGLQYLPQWIVGKASRAINANEVIWQFFQSH